ncbi:Protein of unknown function [Tessaracoccus oleiagri]|uniref:YlxR domain-containing protein n=2 Tax=Tessaracoccus oleiagri TaxID=686624 RepID=A0A1G9LPT5_9ACTN|nr:Protein of unknown function [Tessaracoccus oleiagri]
MFDATSVSPRAVTRLWTRPGSPVNCYLAGMPQRTCIGCRTVDDQAALRRLVRRGDVVVDGTKPRAPGRGAYVHAGCLGLAVRRRAVTRAFGAGAELDPSLSAELERVAE